MLAIGNGEVIWALTWLVLAIGFLGIVIVIAFVTVTGKGTGWIDLGKSLWSLLGEKTASVFKSRS